MRLGGAIEVAPGASAFGARGAALGVEANGLHRREIEHDAAITGAEAGRAVAAAADGHRPSMGAGIGHGGAHIAGIRAGDDGGRAAVNVGVVDPARGFVAGIARPEHGAAASLDQIVHDFSIACNANWMDSSTARFQPRIQHGEAASPAPRRAVSMLASAPRMVRASGARAPASSTAAADSNTSGSSPTSLGPYNCRHWVNSPRALSNSPARAASPARSCRHEATPGV